MPNHNITPDTNTLSAADLIQYFQHRVHTIDHNRNLAAGQGPNFPMVVVFLGEHADENFQVISSRLYQLWPASQNDLLFFSFRDPDAPCKLTLREHTVEHTSLSPEKLQQEVYELSNPDRNFIDFSRILSYYVADTQALKTPEEFQQLMAVQQKAKDQLGIDPHMVLDTLLLMLDESTKIRSDLSLQIQNDILHSAYVGRNFSSMFLISNRKDDFTNAPLPHCLRICAALIALSNNSNPRITSTMFDHNHYIVGYALSEKPLVDISRVCINDLLMYLSTLDAPEVLNHANLLTGTEALNRFQLNEDHILSMLDDYVSTHLDQNLPSVEELNLFPRANRDVEDISDLSQEEFEQLTMGAWTAYLNKTVSDAKARILRDRVTQENWTRTYTQALSQQFSISELIWIRNHMEDMRALFTPVEHNFSQRPVLTAAKQQLRYILASMPEIQELFFNMIQTMCVQAGEFQKQWNILLTSRLSIPQVKPGSVRDFYTQKTSQFWNSYSAKGANEFTSIYSTEDLNAFLHRTIDQLIGSDSVFSANYMNELNIRLNNGQDAASIQTAVAHISALLTNVPKYFRLTFAGDPACIQSVMLDQSVGQNTAMFQLLRNALPETTDYYNTGNSNSAESLEIYPLNNANLLH